MEPWFLHLFTGEGVSLVTVLWLGTSHTCDWFESLSLWVTLLHVPLGPTDLETGQAPWGRQDYSAEVLGMGPGAGNGWGKENFGPWSFSQSPVVMIISTS